MQQVVLITGGSGGIGRAAARAFADLGFRVYEISRRNIPQDGVTHVSADLADPLLAEAAVRQTVSMAGRLDIVVNNAGYGISGAVEETSINNARMLFDVNFFAAAAVSRVAIPYLRESKGRLVHVSSVAGAIAVPFQTYYSASKAALASFSDGLRNELRPFGISVCCLLPGDARTGFTAARAKSESGDSLYGGRIARSVAGMERDEQSGMTADCVAAAIVRAATRRRVAPQYTVGGTYKILILLARLLPRRFVNWLVGRLYAK